MKTVINGLWWPKCSTMERLSIESFLANGHDYHLWAYGPCENVPAGAVVRDANEIMPFREYEHLAQFADHFRYKLLYEIGGWWADSDVICLRPFDFDQDHLISSEHMPARSGKPAGTHVNNVVIKAPKGSPFISWLLERCESADPDKLLYTSLGPLMMLEAVARFAMNDAGAKPETFCPIPYWNARTMLNGTAKLPERSHSIHLWHCIWNRERLQLNQLMGLYGQLHARYGRSPGKILLALFTSDQPKYKDKLKRCLSSWAKTLPERYELKVCNGKSLGVQDDYKHLADKTRAAARYVVEHDYDGMLKVDDDTFLRLEELEIPTADYAGWATEGNASWPVPHAQGGCYYASRAACELLSRAEINKFNSAEDRWVGQVLSGHGIMPTHWPAVVINPDCTWQRDWRPAEPQQGRWSAYLQSTGKESFWNPSRPPSTVPGGGQISAAAGA